MQIFKSLPSSLAAEAFDYDPETGLLTWRARPGEASFNARFAARVAGHRHVCTVGKTYIQVRFKGELHYAHRIAWVIAVGSIPDGMQIDHINGDGADNRLENLRLVTPSGQKRNLRKMKTNTSGFNGVYFDPRRGTYTARVWANGVFRSLGSAKTACEAYEIRLAYNRTNGFHENHGQTRPL